ncbi:hypothetical protein KC351_g104 [Hortaea werneckii]|nr:hypothetical protein KC351_g104 [Hortaea werneckii]
MIPTTTERVVNGFGSSGTPFSVGKGTKVSERPSPLGFLGAFVSDIRTIYARTGFFPPGRPSFVLHDLHTRCRMCNDCAAGDPPYQRHSTVDPELPNTNINVASAIRNVFWELRLVILPRLDVDHKTIMCPSCRACNAYRTQLVMHRKLARSRDCSTGLLDQLSDNTKVDIASAASEEFMPEFETIDCAVQMQPRAIA